MPKLPVASTMYVPEVIGRDLDDLQAIQIFIDSYSRKSAHTVRAYEKEVRRFLLWLRATHGMHEKILPQVTFAEINSYVRFLESPRLFGEDILQANGWDHQPFRVALSHTSIKHALIILSHLFESLRNIPGSNGMPYCLFNPVKLAQDGGGHASAKSEIEEALTEEEMQAVFDAIESLPKERDKDIQHYHRCRWVIHLLYRAFLRREEAANLKMGDFQPVKDGWNIRVLGKGRKKAQIVATEELMKERSLYRTYLGLVPSPTINEDQFAILDLHGKHGVTAQTIYLICKTIFLLAADQIELKSPHHADHLRRASPHWLRHTGISHAMELRIDPRYVQAQARHASLNVTARYDHKTISAWRTAFTKFK